MPSTIPDVVDVTIVGAGISGLYSLYHLRQKLPGWRIKVFEAGTDVGGVWFWNSYPGCRIDTESLSYCYSFDKEILDTWTWKDTFATQSDTHQYLQHVARKHDLYKDIQFDTRIKSAKWNDDQRTWTLVDAEGTEHTTRFLLCCLGFLSAPTLPNIPGLSDFGGEAFHTSRWPSHLDMSRDFAGKNIGVIGTGATGIQITTAISKEASIKSLKVFQRTANWSAPLRNTSITPEQMIKHRGEYNDIFQLCAESPSGFLHQADPRKTMGVTEEERLAFWEKLYSEPGFSKWMGVFSDTYTDRQANQMYSNFIANKIRERVHDPEVADSLIPKNHGFGTRRVPLESGYFEAFNKPNVKLVDLQKTPIERVSTTGIQTKDGEEHPLDILVLATGFDAVTGAFSDIEWQAKDGKPLLPSATASTGINGPSPEELKETDEPIWSRHCPRTFLGLTVPSMPNTFMVLGPHQPLGNATRNVEHAVHVIGAILAHCEAQGYTYAEPSDESVKGWTDHVIECSNAAILVNEVDSWMTGINKNVKGKETTRNVVRYAGSAVEYRRRCEEWKKNDYEGMIFA